MQVVVPSKTNRGNEKMIKQLERTSGKPKRELLIRGRENARAASALTVSDKERTYFEYAVENEPVFQDFLALLIDGDAFPFEYQGGRGAPQESVTQIHWGRVLRSVSQTVQLDKTEQDIVEGTVVTHLEGAIKISAPYHVSRRKRHAVVFKPFMENCVRKVFFERTNNSADPSKAWKLSALTAAKGGTDDTEVHIDALTMKFGEESQRLIQSPLEHLIRVGANENIAQRESAGDTVSLELKVRSSEMEQNVIVLRTALDQETIVRQQLQFENDTREDVIYCQNYRGAVPASAGSSSRGMIAEAVLRSSLYDTGAPVNTSFWVFPL